MEQRTLAGVRVAVTGATGGIGRLLIPELLQLGAKVAGTGTSDERVDALVKDHPELLARPADITSETAVEQFFSFVEEHLHGIDALINLAGVSIPGKIAETSLADFTTMLDVNVVGTFLACKHAIPRLPDNNGLIINVGSMAGQRANPTAPAYCTAKAAVAMFSSALSLQVKERGLRVTNISPGGVDTPFWGDRPVNRDALMTADDVVAALVFVLTRPSHVVVRELSFESTGILRSR